MPIGNPYLFAGLVVAIGTLGLISIRLWREKSALFQKLEQSALTESFANAIMRNSPNEDELVSVLEKYLPLFFPEYAVSFWMFLERELYSYPTKDQRPYASISAWLASKEGIEIIQAGDEIPWAEKELASQNTFVAAIQPESSAAPIAGLILEGPPKTPGQQAAQNLIRSANRIQHTVEYFASFLENIRNTEQSIQFQRIRQELDLASQIQSSLLPLEYPNMPGWQLSFSLRPAGELSGDFFDLIPLGNQKIGILIADVAGKGIAAALYMALCRTLIRTFAHDYTSRPDLVIAECNERLMQDAGSTLFVTAFYGVLDFSTQEFAYANAGHHPPFQISGNKKIAPLPLPLTGIPIGIDEEEEWGMEKIEMAEGDMLILYSDGITDAHNEHGEMFGNKRLLEVMEKTRNKSASQMQDALFARIQEFIEEAPQFDDMTTLILRRENSD